MRFMALMIGDPKAMEGGHKPDPKAYEAMMKYNEELLQAGVLLAIGGLRPPAEAVRVHFGADRKPTVTDGPFAEAREVIGGYSMLQVKSKEEAIEWALRCPVTDPATVELRQLFELSDFAQEAQDSPTTRRVQAALEEQARRK